jgi:pyruvate kinase
MSEPTSATAGSSGVMAAAATGARSVSRPAVNLSNDVVLHALVERVRTLRQGLTDAERQWAGQVAAVAVENQESAINLVHYWAIRQDDPRGIQQQLATFGLSSLERSAPHVQATLEAIGATLAVLAGQVGSSRPPAMAFGDGHRLLGGRTAELLGPEPDNRRTRIMVTLPPEAAVSEKLVLDLLVTGMDVARIDCDHGDATAWARMIRHVRLASGVTGRTCRIAMSLNGPKPLTGPLADGPQVIKLRPTRDSMGRVTAPARCWLTSIENPEPPPHPGLPTLPVPSAWLSGLSVDDSIELIDTRGAHRNLTVELVAGQGALVSVRHTAYVSTGTALRTRGGERASVGALPAIEQFLTLHQDDILVVTRECAPAQVFADGPQRIGCTLPEVFSHLEVGHGVHFDDGKISGVVVETKEDQFIVRITGTGINGSRLRAGKRIHLPDTWLPVTALAPTDRANLPFVTQHADLVELSFARGPGDMTDLLAALDELNDDHLGIVIRVETAQGLKNLPAILLAAMRRRNIGAMIAGGDLAGECGDERLGDIQQEITRLCEAAHLPLIWATPMLDELARTGQPSIVEITEAAMGVRAECVVINCVTPQKGPYALRAISTLDDVLQRMTGHRK